VTILHPTDFSRPAARAEAVAARLARALDAELLLLHVVPESSIYGGGRELLREAFRLEALRVAAARRALSRRAARLRARNVKVRELVATGAPYRQIVSVARRKGSQMIVIGTRARGGVARWLLGSVAERVLRVAPCPVLTVRG
jgi:universal stress protein A